jgi:hypothetical protein
MKCFRNNRGAVSNSLFVAVAVVLIIVAGMGFTLYATTTASTKTTTLTTNSFVTTTEMMSTTEAMNSSTQSMSSNSSNAYPFVAKSGAMISNAYLLVAPIGMEDYAVAVHAEGLEPNGDYVVEGTLSSGSMAAVPISSESMSMNTTSASEFTANQNGTGLYWIEINSNPVTAFENVELLYLPGMSMQNATLVALASFSMMSETTTMTGNTTMMSESTTMSGST